MCIEIQDRDSLLRLLGSRKLFPDPASHWTKRPKELADFPLSLAGGFTQVTSVADPEGDQ